MAITAALPKTYVRTQLKQRTHIPYNITANWKILIQLSGRKFFHKLYQLAYEKFIANSLHYLQVIQKLQRFVNNRKKVINDIQKEINLCKNYRKKIRG